jgi:hypothetical protein
MSGQASPTNWRQVEPEHAAEIDEAIDNVIAALERLAIATDDTMIAAAATGYAIDRLDAWLERDLEGELSSQDPDDEID